MAVKKHTLNLTRYTSEFKTNIKLAVPVMLGQLGHVLVGFADNIMVGKLGAAPLAAVSLANSVFFILMGLGVGFSFAITPLIAEANGAKKYVEGKKNYYHGVLLLGIMGIIISLILLALKPLLIYMNQPPEVVSLALPYYQILAFSMFPLLIFQGIKQFSDGIGLTKFAMIAILAANSLNVLLNYVLIYGKFGFPALGISGAAYGTLVARFMMIAVLVMIIKYRKEFKPYQVAITWWKMEKQRLYTILKLGYPSALQMFFEIGIFASGVILAGMLSTASQAANQIALNLSTMSFMIATGIGVTATIRVGNQKGLKQYADLRRIAYSTVFLVLIFAVVFALIFMIFRNVLPLIYINDVEVVAIAAQLLIISAIFQISDGIQVVILGALRGLQDMLVPMRLIFFSYWIVGFPVCYFLSLKTSLGATGIWIGLCVGLTISAILLSIRFHLLTKRLLLSKK